MNHESADSRPRSKPGVTLALAWLAVGGPLLWGVVETVRKAMALFA